MKNDVVSVAHSLSVKERILKKVDFSDLVTISTQLFLFWDFYRENLTQTLVERGKMYRTSLKRYTLLNKIGTLIALTTTN